MCLKLSCPGAILLGGNLFDTVHVSAAFSVFQEVAVVENLTLSNNIKTVKVLNNFVQVLNNCIE